MNPARAGAFFVHAPLVSCDRADFIINASLPGEGRFEQLMIGAGRLDEMALGGAEGWLPVVDFVEAMQPLGLDDELLSNWRFFAHADFVGP